LKTSFPSLRPPRKDFCRFGSWVGSDRDGNPSVTPEVTWKTACYQRNLVLQKYIDALDHLTKLLSLSLHWSEVQPELLDSLDQDQRQMPEVYDNLGHSLPPGALSAQAGLHSAAAAKYLRAQPEALPG
jgi:phosphoenolpyruvate carboxylase